MSVGIAGQLFVLANLVIALGYLGVPVLVLPFLKLRRRTVVAATVFFVGCFGSHLGMTFDVLTGHDQHAPVGWIAVFWHLLQAVGTWGFILLFRQELRAADALVRDAETTGGTGE